MPGSGSEPVAPPDPSALRAAVREALYAAIAVLGDTALDQHGEKTVCAGFSGGLDSTVLLHLLASVRTEAGINLSALHVHHGLSPHADAWAEHCLEICAALAVPCSVARVTVNRASRTSLEEEARRARLAAFSAAAVPIVVLAQHADDQAETLLLQLLRGAGPKGLAGMPLLKPLTPGAASPLLLRPLLDFPRAALAEYAAVHGLRWIEDESNLDDRLKRNFLRNQVLPVLREGFPAPAETLARAAGHQAAAARLLDVLAEIDLATAGTPSGAQLGIAALLELSDERLKNALRRWLDLAALRQPSTARLNALIRALRESSNDTRLTWEHEGVRLVRRKGLLELQRA